MSQHLVEKKNLSLIVCKRKVNSVLEQNSASWHLNLAGGHHHHLHHHLLLLMRMIISMKSEL